LDERGLVHGKKQGRASLPMREEYHGWYGKRASKLCCNNS
jgi:hypothetical protein